MSPWPWVESLGRASLEGGVLILAVWAISRAWPAVPAWARATLWWMACARLLVGLLPLAAVSVPLIPGATATWWPTAVASTEGAGGEVAGMSVADPAWLTGPVLPAAVPVTRDPAPAPRRAFDPRLLGYAVLTAWLVGVGARTAGHVRQWRSLRRACKQSVPLADGLLASLRPGLPRSVRLAASAEVPAPLVTGLFHPLVLLPLSMLGRPVADLRLAVAHEVAHVRRGDLWLAWVPALAETLFWFHPLLPLCAREYVQACEEACDARALSATGANPYDYGRLLLVLGVQRRLGGATAIPCGSPHPRQLTRRLSMLDHLGPLGPRARRAALGLIAAFALVGLAPLRIVPTQASPAARKEGASERLAAAALQANEPLSSALAGLEPPGEAPSALDSEWEADRDDEAAGERETFPLPRMEDYPDPEETPEPDEWPEPEDIPELVAPVAPVPPVPPIPDEWEDDEDWAETKKKTQAKKHEPRKHETKVPRTPRAVQTARIARAARPATTPRPAKAPRAWGYGYGWNGDEKGDDFSYVIVNGEDESITTSGSGGSTDFQEARRLREVRDTDFIWVRTGGERYLIEDPEFVERAHDVFALQREIGARQSKIGKMQSRMGEAQSRVGERQSKIGELQGEIGARQGEVAMRMAERQRRGALTDELEAIMEELSAQQERLGRFQEELARQMEPLSRQQEELGRQQELLGREMEKASRETQRELRALIEEAIRRGVARRLR